MSFFRPNIDKYISENNISGLIKCTTNRDPEIRIRAFHTLINYLHEHNDTEILTALKKLKRDKDPRVRNTAILKLAEVDDRDILEDFRLIMNEGTQNDKCEVLRMLAAKGKSAPEVSNLIVLALNDKKGIVQLEAIKTMGMLRDKTAIVHLEEKLHDSRFQIRIEAIRALGMIEADAAVDLLIGSLTDNKLEVRRVARDVMEHIGTPKAIKALNDAPLMMMVKRMNESVSSKVDALIYIAKHRFRDALPLIHKAAGDEYKNVRLEAVKALSAIRDKSSIHTLARLTDDPYFDIRLEAVKALEKIIDPRSLKALEKVKDDMNKNVREEAKKAYYFLQTRLKEIAETQA
jgi:HEAT repeat protein